MTSDQPGATQPDGPSGPVRRSRRAGRTSESYDFRSRFGDPEVSERHDGLHEPARREKKVPGRERLTVRELMEQVATGSSHPGSTAPPAHQAPPQKPAVPPAAKQQAPAAPPAPAPPQAPSPQAAPTRVMEQQSAPSSTQDAPAPKPPQQQAPQPQAPQQPTTPPAPQAPQASPRTTPTAPVPSAPQTQVSPPSSPAPSTPPQTPQSGAPQSQAPQGGAPQGQAPQGAAPQSQPQPGQTAKREPGRPPRPPRPVLPPVPQPPSTRPGRGDTGAHTRPAPAPGPAQTSGAPAPGQQTPGPQAPGPQTSAPGPQAPGAPGTPGPGPQNQGPQNQGPQAAGPQGPDAAGPAGPTTAMPHFPPSDPTVDLSVPGIERLPQDEYRAPAAPAAPTESAVESLLDEIPPAETSAPSVGDRLRRLNRPLEPTPDLTGALELVKAERKRKITTGGKQFKQVAAQNAGRVIVALVCVLTLVGTGYAWSIQRSWNASWTTTVAIDKNDPNVRDRAAQHGDETYLIVGTDSRSGKNGKIGGGDSTTIEGARADTILMVSIPADRSRVVAVSWPRDLAVDRPDCKEWDFGTGEYGTDLAGASGVKLNGVYAEGGPQCLVKTLTQMSGLEINHFIAMDFEGFEKVVNQIGGVQVCSKVPLYDYELGYILKKPGSKNLTGRKALNYVRARNISTEGNGDYGRIKRQQLFMSSLLRSALSSDVMSNPAKLNRIVKTFIEYSTVDRVDTNSLIELAESMQEVDAGRVTFVTIPTAGTSTDGLNNELPRTDDVDALFTAIIDDKPLPGEKKEKPKPKADDAPDPSPAPPEPKEPATPGQTEATAQHPSNVTVRVLNGSGESGVATEVMNALIGDEFTVPGVADASNKRVDTVVRYGPGEKDSAATIAKMFPGARIQQDRNVKAGVEIILGSDFGGMSSIADAPSPGSTLTVGQLPKANTNTDLPNDLAVTNAGDTTCS
ncbi:MAG: LCP family protein [Gordonia sp. (in: high G+C Gram-positive bacteria)]|uniref:LCP family glycopolymer transferase n=1 Tax=Gordonia sp. (in: high G+C Gram-positive bacteria) TaxID=84139 RepID=UPI0039E48DD7